MGSTQKTMQFERGLSALWTSVNHIALVVSDVGRSLNFYSDVVGMKQVMRPNFDRHGAWLTFGNIDLHLIKGRPAVHPDDDLIVSHIAITVSNMEELKKRLKNLNVLSRKNVSVPNPSDSDTGTVDQAFVRDPDGYYIEFCNCEKLEEFLHAKMAEAENQKIDLVRASSLNRMSSKLKMMALDSKKVVRQLSQESGMGDYESEVDENELDLDGKPEVSNEKLENLVKRQKVYGDITQNASPEELETLLRYHENKVPEVIAYLEKKVRSKGARTYIPPAFFGRDGSFYQPPAFEMPSTIFQNEVNEKDI